MLPANLVVYLWLSPRKHEKAFRYKTAECFVGSCLRLLELPAVAVIPHDERVIDGKRIICMVVTL